jgi:hypothetical protein
MKLRQSQLIQRSSNEYINKVTGGVGVAFTLLSFACPAFAKSSTESPTIESCYTEAPKTEAFQNANGDWMSCTTVTQQYIY